MVRILVFARDDNYGIGKDNTIPWNNKEDMHFFHKLTTYSKKQNAIICGTVTYESMKHIKLKNRTFFIIGANHYKSISDALNNIPCDYNDIFFVGGIKIFEEAQYLVDDMYISHIPGDFECDKFFKPEFSHFQSISQTNLNTMSISHYKSINTDNTYNFLCKKILDEGVYKSDRTNTGTISIFGHHMKFSLKTLPILTTKKIYTKAIIEELLWFLKGDTNSKNLEDKKVNIWKENSSRSFLDHNNLSQYEEGDCGPIYGFQWRHWNAPYHGPSNEYYSDKYRDKGIDQIRDIIHTIKTNPTSRRMILNAWNVEQLPYMALPPCHVMCQFYVHDNQLDCHMYQRSADVFLGLPFNITSYSLLTYMIAHVTDTTPRNLYISIGDAHIYSNHINQIKTQMKNDKFTPPKLEINQNVKNIDDFSYNDFHILNYQSNPPIKAIMAI